MRILFVLFILASSNLIAQKEILIPERFQFDPHLTYNERIQSPAKFLGYELGVKYTPYAATEQYFKYLAQASDRVLLNQYGVTYQGRKLYTAVITSPTNMQYIAKHRKDNLKFMDPAQTSPTEAEAQFDTKPVVINLSYSIHGNEGSTTEAAQQVAYRLAAADDDETMMVLNNSIVILYICINPDGRDRFVSWYNDVQRNVVATSPKDLEHYEPWPNGRVNHYWFDLNRDWVWLVHPESRGHIKEYQLWMPQVHVDYHEQGYNQNYFTAPGTTPRNLLLPDNYEALTDTIGRANIAAFDKHKINYFTREAFDFFYPSYGSSYPSVMNAIGMLTEQGGIGGGTAIETNDGQVLTLRQKTFDHYLTSMATLVKVASDKATFNRYGYEAGRWQNSKTPIKSYVIADNGDNYVEKLIDIFLHHKVDVTHVTNLNTRIDHDYRTGKSGNIKLDKAYVIHTDQARHIFINSIMNPHMAIEDSVMYDMSTWAVPLAFNLEAYYSNTKIAANGDKVERIEKSSSFQNQEDAYAYVIDWNQENAPKALGMLWAKNYRVRSLAEGFSDGTNSFNPGSLIVLVGRNLERRESFDSDMTNISSQAGVNIVALKSGRMMTGPDLASRLSTPLKASRIAMLIDAPFDVLTAGQIYFLFDQVCEYPIDRIRTSALKQSASGNFGSRYGSVDLNDYDVLILPGGGNGLNQIFDSRTRQQLKDWISNGGTLIANQTAVDFFAKKKDYDLGYFNIMTPATDTSEQMKYLPFKDRIDYMGKKRIPGAAFNVQVDTSHPLNFGVKKELYGLVYRSNGIQPSADYQTTAFFHKDAKSLLKSGYASQENIARLAGQSYSAVANVGSGKIIAFPENTQFRMFWLGPTRMMQNAALLMPSYR